MVARETCGAAPEAAGTPSASTSALRLAERERLGLGEEVGHEQVVVVADLGVGTDEADEVARDQPRALVDQLVVGVLPVGAGLAPHDGPGHAATRVRRRASTDLPLLSMSSCCR